MDNEEIEDNVAGLGGDPQNPFGDDGNATGRMQAVRPAVSVPSVVSSRLSKTSRPSGAAPDPNGARVNAQVPPENLDPIQPHPSSPSSKRIPKIAPSDSLPTADISSEEDAAGDTGKIDAMDTSAIGQADMQDGGLKTASSKGLSSTGLPVISASQSPGSDSFSIDSIDLDPKTKKGIEVRKEQIQRAQKRAITQKRKRIVRIVRRITISLLVLVLIALIATISVFRWGLYDDYEDMQGKWKIAGTDATVKIADGKITLSKEVQYDFELDSNSKTMSFDFGQLDGNGRYRFSVDRNRLSILDGEFNTTDTLLEDIPWTFEALWDYVAVSEIKDPNLGDAAINLERVEEE